MTAYYAKRGIVLKPPPRKAPPRRKGKNKTEAEFEAWFKFEHPSLTIVYEAMKLRIDETCWYLPDFWCPELLAFYEVKGPVIPGYAEDGIIKFKACRKLHSWAKFKMFQKRHGEWREIRKLPGEGEG